MLWVWGSTFSLESTSLSEDGSRDMALFAVGELVNPSREIEVQLIRTVGVCRWAASQEFQLALEETHFPHLLSLCNGPCLQLVGLGQHK